MPADLDALLSRLSDATRLSAFAGLLEELGESPKTRPTAERWIRKLTAAARVERGTLLTTGIAPWDRARLALDRVSPAPAERGPRPKKDWARAEGAYEFVLGSAKKFRVKYPKAKGTVVDEWAKHTYRKWFGDDRPLEFADLVEIRNAKTPEQIARVMVVRAYETTADGLRYQFLLLKRRRVTS